MALQLPNDSDDEVLSQINTTPLVDVMLVLLIIFLITIPVVTASVPVNLPQENNQPRDTNPAIVTIAVDAHGKVYWQDVALQSPAEVAQRIQSLVPQSKDVQVQIRADARVDFEPVAQVMQMLKEHGISNVGFVMEPQ